MPYPRHWLFVMGGHTNAAGANSEIWQCGFRGVPGVETDYGHEEDVLANITPAVKAWFTAPANHLRNDATLEYLKLNEIGPDGKYVDVVTHQVDIVPSVTGGATAAVPPVLTTAVSWRTAARRGPAHHGRIYPPFAIDANNSMLLSEVEQTVYATAGVKLLDAVAAAPSSSPAVAFRGMSIRCVSPQGAIREVNGVRVGSVLDIQRRRKDALIETYKELAYP